MKNNIGVMQGRLLPKYQGRYQAHPVGYWQDEFKIAQQIGLDCIEAILDYNDAEQNPLLNRVGINEINALAKKTGVRVFTVCADYLMHAPLHSEDPLVANRSQAVMKRLIHNASKLGVTDVVIPCVDQSSLNLSKAQDQFVDRIKPLVKTAEKTQINLSSETDLAPLPFVKLLERIGSKRVTVNYDIGNSAALGYDPEEELSLYGECITDIHIKDRLLGGGPVMLGSGCANFDVFFNKLK